MLLLHGLNKNKSRQLHTARRSANTHKITGMHLIFELMLCRISQNIRVSRSKVASQHSLKTTGQSKSQWPFLYQTYTDKTPVSNRHTHTHTRWDDIRGYQVLFGLYSASCYQLIMVLYTVTLKSNRQGRILQNIYKYLDTKQIPVQCLHLCK